MNRKQLIILLIGGVLIGGLGLYLSSRRAEARRSGEPALGQKVIADFPINDVAAVAIKAPDAELTLVKTDELWRVKERWNYPANFSEISSLLRKIWELKTMQSVNVGPSKLGRLNLLPPDSGTNAATVLEFKDKEGKTVETLLLGKQHMRDSGNSSPLGGGEFPVGRYVMVPGDKPRVSLVSETFSEVESKPDRWLDKTFFKVEKLKAVSVTAPEETNSWNVVRETEGGELKLADAQEGEQLDTSKASSVGWALSSPSFNDVVAPDATPEQTGLSNPRVAKLETFEGFVYTVKVGNKTAEDNYHIQVAVDASLPKERVPDADEKPEDKEKLDKEFEEKRKKLEEKLAQEKAVESWTYLVSKWSIDPILKNRSELLVEKKPETPAPLDATGASNLEPLKTDGLQPPLPPKQPDTQ